MPTLVLRNGEKPTTSFHEVPTTHLSLLIASLPSPSLPSPPFFLGRCSKPCFPSEKGSRMWQEASTVISEVHYIARRFGLPRAAK